MKAIPKKFRYDISGVMGSGCIINVVTGARTFGKTYGWKKRGIKNFIEKGETWGYLRTFDQEIKDIIADGPDAWFSDIMRNDEFPGWKFRVLGRTMQAGRVLDSAEGKEKVDWKVMGQMLSLTKYQSYKGKNVANMTLLVFDEFIRETRVPPYPQNCVNSLINLWETLDRREDRIKIVMLANAADAVNPYFVQWHITPPDLGCHAKFPVGRSFVYVENDWSPQFDAYADESEIGKFTAGSAYQSYAQKNVFRNVDGRFVDKRPKRSTPYLTVVWKGEPFSVWMDMEELGRFFVEPGECDGRKVAITREDLSVDVLCIERNHPVLRDLVARARKGWVYFSSDAVREKFWYVLEMCGFH